MTYTDEIDYNFVLTIDTNTLNDPSSPCREIASLLREVATRLETWGMYAAPGVHKIAKAERVFGSYGMGAEK